MKKSTIGKLAAFTLMFVFVLLCTMKLTATATAIPADKVKVDYVNETITVETDDKIVYFTENYVKDVEKWSACEVREITVKDENGNDKKINAAMFDISWVNENKTIRIYVCGDKNTEVINVDITWEEDFGVDFIGTLLTTDITEAEEWKKVYNGDPANAAKYPGYPKFSEETGYFIFTRRENGRDMSYFDLENIQWRKGDDGVWRDYDELDLREMNIRGIKLEFRIVASNTGGARASSVASASVSKLPSQPKVSVNENTMTVAMKNGMEFSFDKKTWIMIPEYNKKFGTEENKFVTETERAAAIETIYTSERVTSILMQEFIKEMVPDFTLNTPMSKSNLEAECAGKGMTFTNEGLLVYVRDAGTKRKAASKILEVYIPYADENVEQEIADVANAKIAFSYGESKTNTGGIVVNNNSADYKYQVAVIKPTDDAYQQIKAGDKDNIDLSGISWTSVKPGKMLKISNKKVPKESYLLYRIAGEDDSIPSSYQVYGPLKFDHLTYVGIANAKKISGQTLKAVISTNLTENDVTYQWEYYKKNDDGTYTWTSIAGATTSEYKLTNNEADTYVRVVVTRVVPDDNGKQKTIIMESDQVGPVKGIKQEAPATPTPTP